jgi:hypothetical protein
MHRATVWGISVEIQLTVIPVLEFMYFGVSFVIVVVSYSICQWVGREQPRQWLRRELESAASESVGCDGPATVVADGAYSQYVLCRDTSSTRCLRRC